MSVQVIYVASDPACGMFSDAASIKVVYMTSAIAIGGRYYREDLWELIPNGFVALPGLPAREAAALIRKVLSYGKLTTRPMVDGQELAKFELRGAFRPSLAISSGLTTTVSGSAFGE